MNPKNTISRALPLGRVLRFALGVFFVSEVWPVYMDVTIDEVLTRLGWAIGLMVIYLLLHLFILKFAPKFNSVIGAILAFGPLLAVFFIGYGGPAATGALTYLAVALLTAAIRGDGGCEVMSVPALFTGKHTHLTCLLFSPIDWCEGKFR
ncbi:hypothetical protein ABN763_00475 [Spongiivirga sp. MCCC 1A20706]|uniref:hypothetical protein n=1 Tax=Spongiivirga sp. MCCC 1A20706 TaxID=3160963 RepID=UPI003977B5D9